MANRKDGMTTQDKLLEAAAEVFAEKGYREATVQEICQKAGSNIAAVNYHFGGKENLYSQVWRQSFQEALRVYPPTGGLPADAPAQDRLRALVYSHLHRILDDGRLGFAGRIILQEMSQPTHVPCQVRRDAIGPLHELTQQIIKDLLGRYATQRDIGFCQMSVMHQCLSLGFRGGKLPPYLCKGKPSAELLDSLIEHTTRFLLHGIAGVRAEIEQRVHKV